jgi:hypothetical protein
MKRFTLQALTGSALSFALAPLAFAQAAKAPHSGAVVFGGKVDSITITPTRVGVEPTAILTLKTKKGKSTKVDLGPLWYFDGQPVHLGVGDTVTASGSWQGKDTIIAQDVSVHGETVALRDEHGKTAWGELLQPTTRSEGSSSTWPTAAL